MAGRVRARRAPPGGAEEAPVPRRRVDEAPVRELAAVAADLFVAEGFLVAFFPGLFSAAFFWEVGRGRELAFLALLRDEDRFAALLLVGDFFPALLDEELFFAAVFLADDFFADDFRAELFFAAVFLADDFFADVFGAGLLRPEVLLELDFRVPLDLVEDFRFREGRGALDLRVGFLAGLMGAGR